jgi:MFS family permease
MYNACRYNLSSFQSGLVVSMSLLGALTGSLLALISGNKIGRRSELMLAAVLYGVGATLLGVSPNLGVLLAARVFYGLGIGFAMHAGAQCRVFAE